MTQYQAIGEWLKVDAAAAYAGFSKRTLYLEIGRGSFPRPVQISARRVAWRKTDLDAWLARKVAERDSQAA